MTTKLASFDTGHEEMIHDAQMDYYAKRLATCSSDKCIKIFEVTDDTQVQSAVLQGHEGPVWRVAWAHPKFGSILASCGYDRKVIIWREGSKNQWSNVFEYTGHTLSVNSIAWAPHENQLILACGSSDGKVSILSYQNGGWSSSSFTAHLSGVNSVSWCPNLSDSEMRIATGGCDNLVKIWRFQGESWITESILEGHQDWVRDVEWSMNPISQTYNIASASQDGSVFIWTQNLNSQDNIWKKFEIPLEKRETVWTVSWSITGNILAITSGDNNVTLWKAQGDKWIQTHSVDD